MRIIRQLRKDKGWTQQRTADETGMNIRRMQEIEAGKIKLSNMTGANLYKLAQAFGVSMEYLLDNEELTNPTI